MPHPARVLEQADVRHLLDAVSLHRHSLRDRVLVLLSYKAGLRACEMSGLDWTMVLTPKRGIASQLYIAASIAKNAAARHVPVHPDLANALLTLHRSHERPRLGPVIRSERGNHMTPRSIVNWFARLYDRLGLDGCSSHSGRRTFITRSARLLARTGGSLRDVQELAGHRRLTTTERYIEGDRAAQHRLIRLV